MVQVDVLATPGLGNRSDAATDGSVALVVE